MKDLNEMGVREMQHDQLQKESGGWVGQAFAYVACMYLTDVIVNWDDHKEAFLQGYEMGRN